MQQTKGVFSAQKKDGTTYYRSSITYRRKHISLGSFSKMEDAGKCYEEAAALLKDTSLTVLHYSKHSKIPFDKWVCLINFRDNHIYFPTPIYLRPTFFYYFLSPSLELKFDKDDLFYYSNKTIMKRNGHLFVADYGMQINILNRYGIKNYSVLNRDYRFLNGDTTDFRYSNIEIINRYNGVLKVNKNGKESYKAKIHVRGDYIVGYYETETEAAIAYNKAIDILQKAGSTKKYTPNFIEGVSNADYAHIYLALKISPKLAQINFTSSRNQ